MERVNLALVFFILMFLANLVLYIYQPLGESFYIISDIIVIFFSFLASIIGFYAFKLHGLKSLQGRVLFFLSLGVFFWFLGETTWGVYEIFFGIKAPVASLADFFWLIGYPIFFFGLYHTCKIVQVKIKKTKLFFLILFALLLFTFAFYLSYSTITSVELNFLEKLSTVGYVIGDFLLLLFSICAITSLLKTETFKLYFLIIFSIISMCIADIYYMNFLETYEAGNLIDLFWDLSYILLAFGFFYNREAMKNLLKKV